jgi:DNA-binding transcriptional regulator LsrR (DeoR family)
MPRAKVDPLAIIAYAAAHPGMKQSAIAAHYATGETNISRILRKAAYYTSKAQLSTAVTEYASAHPNLTQSEIARHFSISRERAYTILHKAGAPNRRGTNHSARREAVVAYAGAHPLWTQKEIGEHFGLKQCTVSHMLLRSGKKGIPRRSAPRQRWYQTEEQYEWERILCRLGLSMGRGQNIGPNEIGYGHKYWKNQVEQSATLISR